jgi:hypothetical protein
MCELSGMLCRGAKQERPVFPKLVQRQLQILQVFKVGLGYDRLLHRTPLEKRLVFLCGLAEEGV